MISKRKVKEEILEDVKNGVTDFKAFLYSAVISFGSLSLENKKFYLSIETDEDVILLKSLEALKSLYNIGAALSVTRHKKSSEKKIDLNEKDTFAVLSDLAVVSTEDGRVTGFLDGLGERYLNDEAFKTFMRIAFLKNGVIRTPNDAGEGGYYLEVVFAGAATAADAAKQLEKYDIKAKLLERNQAYAVYIKDGESVSAFLALISASDSALALQEILVVRGERNNSNRRANCDSHNMDKSAEASANQILAINKIISAKGGLDALQKELRETAESRIKNNTATIGELSEILGVSKGCVQHRLKKLMYMASEIS
ncbi:MAG: DNA-binding protein WhiA [Clostridiales bacterium]|jgi:DNA-binding protein WhiA|nr:DNA-binding protein WhiA [Clostridiales bacterium]